MFGRFSVSSISKQAKALFSAERCAAKPHSQQQSQLHRQLRNQLRNQLRGQLHSQLLDRVVQIAVDVDLALWLVAPGLKDSIGERSNNSNF